MLANVLLNVVFLFYFFAKLKNGGPALASAMAAYFNVFTLFVIFRLRFGRMGTRDIAVSLAKIAASASAMGVVCWTALRYSHFDSINHFFPRLVVFVALIGGATLTYLGLAWALRCSEISEVYGIAFRSAGAETAKPGMTG
jgi:peptidoglycan biosynthesis protein MviN/MurJ (putative lipid II flippase)